MALISKAKALNEEIKIDFSGPIIDGKGQEYNSSPASTAFQNLLA